MNTRTQIFGRRALAIAASVTGAAVIPVGTDAQVPRRAVTLNLTIGVDDSKGDAYTFSAIRTVASSRDGRVFVLDQKDCVVKVFDASGKYLTKFGRRGAGPGEFTSPFSLSMIVSDTDVLIRDGNQRRVRFSLSGVPTVTTADTAASFTTATYQLSMGARLRVREAWIGAVKGKPTPNPWQILMLESASSARVDTIARLRSDAVFFYGPGGYGALMSGFDKGGAWAFSGDSLLGVVDGYAGVANWYAFAGSGVHVVRTDTLGERAKPIAASELAAMETRLRKGAGGMLKSPAMKIVEGPTHHSVATNAVFDNLGSLWVSAAATPKKTIVWTVFPPVGRGFVVELPATFTLSTVRGEKLYGFAESETGLPVAQVYSLGR